MSCPLPPRIELPDPPLGPLAALRAGRENLAATIPGALLHRPMMSGRTVWRWHSLAAPGPIRHVLADRVADYPKSRLMHRALRPAIRHSLMLDEGAEWAWQRRAVGPCLAPRAVAAMLPDIAGAVDTAVAALPGEGRIAIDGLEFGLDISMRVAARLIDGGAGRALVDRAEFQRAFGAYMQAVIAVSPFDLLGLPGWVPQPWGLGRARNLRRLHGMMDEIIARRMARKGEAGRDLLGRLIAAEDPETGRRMEPARLRDNLLVFFVGAHETSANTLAWALWLLAGAPDWQERVREEARAAAARELADRPAALAETGRVLDETMRLYAPFPLLMRQAAARDEICGAEVRRGDYVFVPLYALHRSRLYWERADEFDPSRFEAPPRRPGFLPFSTGPRVCPGAHLAGAVLRLALAAACARFRFARSPGPAPEPRALMALRPHGGVKLEAERLD